MIFKKKFSSIFLVLLLIGCGEENKKKHVEIQFHTFSNIIFENSLYPNNIKEISYPVENVLIDDKLFDIIFDKIKVNDKINEGKGVIDIKVSSGGSIDMNNVYGVQDQLDGIFEEQKIDKSFQNETSIENNFNIDEYLKMNIKRNNFFILSEDNLFPENSPNVYSTIEDLRKAISLAISKSDSITTILIAYNPPIPKVAQEQRFIDFKYHPASPIYLNSKVNFSNLSNGYNDFVWKINGVKVSNSKDYTHVFTSLGSSVIELCSGQDCVKKNINVIKKTIVIPGPDGNGGNNEDIKENLPRNPKLIFSNNSISWPNYGKGYKYELKVTYKDPLKNYSESIIYNPTSLDENQINVREFGIKDTRLYYLSVTPISAGGKRQPSIEHTFDLIENGSKLGKHCN